MTTAIRVFIAVELPDEARRVLTNLQNRLKAIAPPRTVRWTAPQNIHLTLHFLGDTPPEKVEQVKDSLITAVESYSPFSLTLSGLGCFPNLRRPRIVWVGVSGQTEPLIALQRSLGELLARQIDFAPDKRPYSPHLTIGRVKQGVPSRHLRQLSAILEGEQAVGNLIKFPVAEISLIKSELKPTGAVYTALSQASF